MDKLTQVYIETVAFKNAIDREELLIRKCRDYYAEFDNKDLKELDKNIEDNSQENIKMLKDKMIKLNIQK